MTAVSEQTRRNRSIGGRKAAEGAKRTRDWRQRGLDAVGAAMAGVVPDPDYRAPSIKTLLRRIRTRQEV